MPVNTGSLTKIAVISGQSLIWIGLQAILESTRTFRIVGSPIQRLAAPEVIADCQPDVIIIDTETERDAVDGIKQLRDSTPHSKIMLLSGFEQKDPVREALEYGIDGVILKIHPPRSHHCRDPGALPFITPFSRHWRLYSNLSRAPNAFRGADRTDPTANRLA